MSFGNKGLIYVKKRTFPQIAVLYIMLLPFCFGFFIELLRVPNIIKYTIDVFWIGLLFLMIFKRSIMVKKNTVVSLLLILAFLLYSFTVYLFNYQSPFYFLWGLRNNFRFYVFFFAVISFTAIEDVDLIFKILDVLFWVNAVISLIQYFVLGYDGDRLGGIFGTEVGANAYTMIFFSVILSKSLLSYMSKAESTLFCFSKCGAALFISALAELKAFYIIFFIIMVFSAILTAFSWRKLIIIALLGVVAVFSAMLLAALFDFENFLSFENIWRVATQEHYSEAGTLNRLSAIPVLARTMLTEFWERLFGLGLGNCDTSAFEICNSVFYQNYGHLRYSWFSCAILFLETGYIGILLFLAFFVVCYIMSSRQLKSGKSYPIYCQMAMIMSVICVILTFYNSSLRTESAYMLYFVLALPFIGIKSEDSLEF